MVKAKRKGYLRGLFRKFVGNMYVRLTAEEVEHAKRYLLKELELRPLPLKDGLEPIKQIRFKNIEVSGDLLEVLYRVAKETTWLWIQRNGYVFNTHNNSLKKELRKALEAVIKEAGRYSDREVNDIVSATVEKVKAYLTSGIKLYLLPTRRVSLLNIAKNDGLNENSCLRSTYCGCLDDLKRIEPNPVRLVYVYRSTEQEVFEKVARFFMWTDGKNFVCTGNVYTSINISAKALMYQSARVLAPQVFILNAHKNLAWRSLGIRDFMPSDFPLPLYINSDWTCYSSVDLSELFDKHYITCNACGSKTALKDAKWDNRYGTVCSNCYNLLANAQYDDDEEYYEDEEYYDDEE